MNTCNYLSDRTPLKTGPNIKMSEKETSRQSLCSPMRKFTLPQTTRKLSVKANNIMRLLRQISLDSSILRHNSSTGANSKPTSDNQSDKLGTNFAQHLYESIDGLVSLLTVSSAKCDRDGQTPLFSSPMVNCPNTSAKKSNAHCKESALKSLEELNSMIVHLIRLCSDYKSDKSEVKVTSEKPKSKLRRHYSAFVESGQLFWVKKSLHSLPNGCADGYKENGHSMSRSNDTHSLINSCGCSMEEVTQRLVDTKILILLLNAIPDMGFEEKKMIRIVLTNTLILEANKCRPIVDYFCDPSNGILKYLIESYQIGRSDVTLNCGAILRFATQYEPIVSAILKSECFYNFFEFMQRSPSDYPFDVAMDVFYTFKTILTRHKATTSDTLQLDCDRFFNSFIHLLAHADQTENYVTKRQSLEIFADIFSGHECNKLRAKFISEDCFICPVVAYLWNRNLQIRLRCLVLLNQLFRLTQPAKKPYTSDTPIENGDARCSKKPKSLHSNKENGSKQVSADSNKDQWQMDLLVEKIRFVHHDRLNQDIDKKSSLDDQSTLFQTDLNSMFVELKFECKKSTIRQFTLQTIFVNEIIKCLC